MKVQQLFSNPLPLAISFCFIPIVGEKLSFFYLLVLMFGIYFGALHSILGLGGLLLALLLPSFKLSLLAKHGLSLLGAFVLLLSLLSFFLHDEARYNCLTFSDNTALVMLILFASLWILFVLQHLRYLAIAIVQCHRKAFSMN